MRRLRAAGCGLRATGPLGRAQQAALRYFDRLIVADDGGALA
ncbi:hypothetical protein [Streptomyces xanthophaeus]|nr:hypothetical protein [Streptomyces xanthophaeus]